MEVVGHAATLARFRSAMAAQTLHHAWLLYGVKGIGKRTLAEKLAAMLLCEEQRDCGQCHACKMLAAGAHPDLCRSGVLEGKRDVSIQQVRELLGFLALSSAEGGRRVVLLDDAERMNQQAANALLKGLEEPTAESVLLIVCADIERLPATVRSRCMLESCAPLDDQQVRYVLSTQQPAIDAAYLDLAVSLADGAPGLVQCMQDKQIAQALQTWGELVADLAHADVGRIEAWIRSQIKLVPHALLVRSVVQPLAPALQQQHGDYARHAALLQALEGVLRWPGDVVRHTLRAGPSLLAQLLKLRAALLA